MFVERRSEKGFSFSQPLTDRAFGVVYEGLRASDKSAVAIKVIPCNTNLPFLDEEAKALHSVKSEYVVKYVDVVVEPREVWVGQFSLLSRISWLWSTAARDRLVTIFAVYRS